MIMKKLRGSFIPWIDDPNPVPEFHGQEVCHSFPENNDIALFLQTDVVDCHLNSFSNSQKMHKLEVLLFTKSVNHMSKNLIVEKDSEQHFPYPKSGTSRLELPASSDN
ncbi:uncharacterized protein G2W53_007253 [Senna tora]|uniref:Uncharacterized protein n=1 Tax=Senna tora TaxID=362788 RepID=A0A835CES0_9FABA|nr:uncharacterized protein G2W53_007253 [Senna tora]